MTRGRVLGSFDSTLGDGRVHAPIGTGLLPHRQIDAAARDSREPADAKVVVYGQPYASRQGKLHPCREHGVLRQGAEPEGKGSVLPDTLDREQSELGLHSIVLFHMSLLTWHPVYLTRSDLTHSIDREIVGISLCRMSPLSLRCIRLLFLSSLYYEGKHS